MPQPVVVAGERLEVTPDHGEQFEVGVLGQTGQVQTFYLQNNRLVTESESQSQTLLSTIWRLLRLARSSSVPVRRWSLVRLEQRRVLLVAV